MKKIQKRLLWRKIKVGKSSHSKWKIKERKDKINEYKIKKIVEKQKKWKQKENPSCFVNNQKNIASCSSSHKVYRKFINSSRSHRKNKIQHKWKMKIHTFFQIHLLKGFKNKKNQFQNRSKFLFKRNWSWIKMLLWKCNTHKIQDNF